MFLRGEVPLNMTSSFEHCGNNVGVDVPIITCISYICMLHVSSRCAFHEVIRSYLIRLRNNITIHLFVGAFAFIWEGQFSPTIGLTFNLIPLFMHWIAFSRMESGMKILKTSSHSIYLSIQPFPLSLVLTNTHTSSPHYASALFGMHINTKQPNPSQPLCSNIQTNHQRHAALAVSRPPNTRMFIKVLRK